MRVAQVIGEVLSESGVGHFFGLIGSGSFDDLDNLKWVLIALIIATHAAIAFGVAVHVGARIESLASPGEILVSAVVKELVMGSGIAFSPTPDAGRIGRRGVAV